MHSTGGQTALDGERAQENTNVIIVLAMHGAPPNDFPEGKLGEFLSLHMQLHHSRAEDATASQLHARYAALEETILAWPRTPHNDPFYAASQRLAQAVGRISGYDVIVGFNEFCSPNLEEALDLAASRGPERVIVVTPMMTPGGEHAEVDIPAAVDAARGRHRRIDFHYAWPFETQDVARFLASHALRITGTAAT